MNQCKHGFFWYVYKTTCIINGKVYVGVHKSNKLQNNYIGCCVMSDVSANKRAKKIKSPFVQAVAKYGYSNFYKEILKVFNNSSDAYKMEAEIVNAEWVKSNLNYNAALGGEKVGKPSKYLHLIPLWKNMYQSGMTMKEIAKRTGLTSHTQISIHLNGLVNKRKKYVNANRAREMKLFCVEHNKRYDSQKSFLMETFGECRSHGNLSVAIKNGSKYRGLTVMEVK